MLSVIWILFVHEYFGLKSRLLKLLNVDKVFLDLVFSDSHLVLSGLKFDSLVLSHQAWVYIVFIFITWFDWIINLDLVVRAHNIMHFAVQIVSAALVAANC